MRSLLQTLQSFWLKASNYGIPDDLPAKLRRRASLTQQTAIVVIVVFFSNICLYVVVEPFWTWFPNAIGLLHGIIFLALCYRGNREVARHFGILGINLLLIYFAYAWGPGIAMEVLPVVPAILGTLYFDRWKPITFHFLFSVLAFGVINFIYLHKFTFEPLAFPTISYYINSLTVFVTLLTFVLFFRRLQNAYAEDLEKANQHIMDSIRYAKRIQNGLLGTPEELLSDLKGGMVFFRPRDIVSGDFYWSAEVDGKQIMVIADCTGHGVPGAFMTVMGATFLEEIVKAQGITDPGQILHRLDERVIQAVTSKGNQSQDGMDVAILVLDKGGAQVHFAGAKNPLLAIGPSGTTYTKGSVFPIGNLKLKKEKTFLTHNFPWEPGTRFYMYSDGYQDQFGGQENRKFLTRHFRDMLCTISSMPWQKQRDHLDQTLQNWQGKEAQTDDILVVGLEI